MNMSRRNLLAGAGAAAASTLLARSAAAQSFPFTPNQRYPDPAVQILDPSFAKYRLYSSTVEQVATGMRWAEGPAYFPEGGYLLFSDIPNNRIMKWDEQTGAVSVYRLGRFPVTLYYAQWTRLLEHAEELRVFLETNKDKLKLKGQQQAAGAAE